MTLQIKSDALLLDTGSLAAAGACCCGAGCNCTLKECLDASWEAVTSDADLACKCTSDAACLVIESIGDITITVTGNGTGRAMTSPVCSAASCTWDGTFVVPCGLSPVGFYAWQKGVFVCTAFSGGSFKNFYYVQEIRITMQAQGYTAGTAATFSIVVELRSGLVNFVPSATWSNTSVSGWDTFSGCATVHTYSGTILELYEWNETGCEKTVCQPVGSIVECETSLSDSVGDSHSGTQSDGCYPDPANVTVAATW